jgi:hypothetical protein
MYGAPSSHNSKTRCLPVPTATELTGTKEQREPRAATPSCHVPTLPEIAPVEKRAKARRSKPKAKSSKGSSKQRPTVEGSSSGLPAKSPSESQNVECQIVTSHYKSDPSAVPSCPALSQNVNRRKPQEEVSFAQFVVSVVVLLGIFCFGFLLLKFISDPKTCQPAEGVSRPTTHVNPRWQKLKALELKYQTAVHDEQRQVAEARRQLSQVNADINATISTLGENYAAEKKIQQDLLRLAEVGTHVRQGQAEAKKLDNHASSSGASTAIAEAGPDNLQSIRQSLEARAEALREARSQLNSRLVELQRRQWRGYQIDKEYRPWDSDAFKALSATRKELASQ